MLIFLVFFKFNWRNQDIFTEVFELINDQCSASYRNQSIDLQSKSIDWFLYDREHWLLMV